MQFAKYSTRLYFTACVCYHVLFVLYLSLIELCKKPQLFRILMLSCFYCLQKVKRSNEKGEAAVQKVQQAAEKAAQKKAKAADKAAKAATKEAVDTQRREEAQAKQLAQQNTLKVKTRRVVIDDD